jgi:hypothetical protein
MMRRWLLLVGTLLAFGVVTAAAASTQHVPSTGGRPVDDIRPYLAAHPLPQSVLDRARALPAVKPALRANAAGPYVELIDDFEGAVLDPFKWITFDEDGPVNGEYYWGLSNCRVADDGGKQALWAIGAGEDGKNLSCGAVYPPGVASGLLKPLDLTGWETPPDQLEITFETWLNMRTESINGVVPDGLFVMFLEDTGTGTPRPVVLQKLTGQFPPDWWKTIVIDLVNACDVYQPDHCVNLAGRSKVLLEWLFLTKDEAGGEMPEGAYIDNVRLVASVPPQVTATKPATPTATATATVSGTITATVTATITGTVTATTPVPTTETPSPTPTPTYTPPTPGYPVYLPVALKNAEIALPEPGPEPTSPSLGAILGGRWGLVDR